MKILSIDTASNICGVSILEDTKLICNLDTNTGRTHSENLMPMIERIFCQSNLSLHDIDLFVCDIGPGSFTGLRIGVATVKAFTDSLCIPCIGISSLKCLAYNMKDALSENECVCSLIDCKNDNCYFALYEKKGNAFNTLIEPQAENIEGALLILKNYLIDTISNPSITFVGDGSQIYQQMFQTIFPNSKFATSNQNSLNSYSLALAGLQSYHLGITSQEILPLYLKKPQAQRQLEEREKKNEKIF